MRRWNDWMVAAVIVLAGVGVVTCKQNMDMDRIPGADMTVDTLRMDGSIAATLNAANEGEIQVGQLAPPRAMDAAVKAFALRMVSEHTAAQQRLTALLTRLGLNPMENTTSRQLRQETAATIDTLQTKTGAAFDRAYITSQTTMHARVLGLIDRELLPTVRSADLRTELQQVRMDVAKHLQDAEAIRTMLGGDGDGGTPGDGGTVGDGGTPGDGGMAGDGGTPGDGGMVGDGGTPGDGGMAGDGGVTADGGMTGDGGMAGDGGAPTDGP